MRSLSLSLAGLLLCASVAGCHESPPTIKVRNERSTKANVQFKNAVGNTTNINDVVGGTLSGTQEVDPGPYTVTAVIQSEGVSPTMTFTARNDENYTLVVVVGSPPTLRVEP